MVQMLCKAAGAAAIAVALIAAGTSLTGRADEGHGHGKKGTVPNTLEQMQEMHKGHAHEHRLEAMKTLGPQQMQQIMAEMREIGLGVPPMNSHRGRELFVQTGCVVCHSSNDVGGKIGPPINAEDMPQPMNVFEFAARMWRGGETMIAMQKQLFGKQIALTGQDLADLVAFAHDRSEQKKLSTSDVPKKFRELYE